MKTLLISLALVLVLSGVTGGQIDADCLNRFTAAYPKWIGANLYGGLQASINQWCAENPPFIQGKTFTVLGRRGDFGKIVNDFLDKHPDYWFGGASEKELYNKPKPGQPYPTEWRYDPRNTLEFVFYPINPDNPLKENGCYERWKANSPDYPKTIGNTTAKEFRDLVDGWCVKNPPEKGKPKPCRWEVMFITVPGIETRQPIKIPERWEPWFPSGNQLWLRRKTCSE